jgi:hypothetical protein
MSRDCEKPLTNLTVAQEPVAKTVQVSGGTPMRGIRGLALLFLAVFLLNAPPSEGQESRVTRGDRVVFMGFDVDVLVDGEPLPKCQGRGGTYIEALRGQEYEIRIRSRSSERVAVALYVDGVNTIDSTRTPASDASKWLIEPHQTITISGWQMNADLARRFYFTTERDSYAARLGVVGGRGVIWAAFYRERRRRPITVVPPQPMPRRSDKDESQSSADLGRSAKEAPTAAAANKSRSRDEAATGIGRSVRHDVEYVDMDLESQPAAEVTIRYNYGGPERDPISESNPKYKVRDKRGN